MARAAQKAKPKVNFPEKYWVFGADLSLKRPGFCRFRVDKSSGSPVITELYTDSVDNKLCRNKPHGQELEEIFYGLGTFRPQKDIPDPEPVLYVREKGIHVKRSANTEGAIYEVVGVSSLWLWQYRKEWYEINPKTVKRIITGDQNAEKNVVANYIKLYIGDHDFKNDDESDACAVALAWLIDNGELENKLERKKEKDNHDKENETCGTCGRASA